MVGGSARVVAGWVHVGPNHAGYSRLPACHQHYIASGRIGAHVAGRSERTGGLRFESYGPGGGRGFW
jgi:hypothetical protein